MMIRRYAGTDERVLIRRIRSDFGADAIILHTTYGRRKGVFGFFRSKRVEIVAGSAMMTGVPGGNASFKTPARRRGGKSVCRAKSFGSGFPSW